MLASPDATDELKPYDLVWLLHLVGDVHQPLHCAARVSKNFPNGDAGGNKVLVSWRASPTKLHSFWDGCLGIGAQDTVADLADTLKPAKKSQVQCLDEEDWIKEGSKLAKTQVYAAPIGKGRGPFALSTGYRKKAIVLAKQRVELAGERLAKLLNAELR